MKRKGRHWKNKDGVGRPSKQQRQEGESQQLEACLLPLERGWDQEQLLSFLAGVGIDVPVARKQKQWGYGFVHFRSVEDRREAERILAEQKPTGEPISVRDAVLSKGMSQRVDPSTIDIRDVVSPLWRLPYGEQLVKKHARVATTLIHIRKKIVKAYFAANKGKGTPDFPPWLVDLKEKGTLLCAPLLGILRSPQVDCYRNKCEFTIGPGLDGQPVVGFCLGAYKDGIIQVAPPDTCRHISPQAVRYAALTQHFLRTQSKLPAWEKRQNSGFWRLLIVRQGRENTFLPRPDAIDKPEEPLTAGSFTDLDWQRWLVPLAEPSADGGASTAPQVDERCPGAPLPDQAMVVVQIDPGFADPNVVWEECAALALYLQEAAAAEGLPLTSLMLQHHSGMSNAAPVDSPLLPFPAAAGNLVNETGHIRDTLAGLHFDISPSAFFQVNSGAAAVLYKLVGEWAAPDPDTVLLDVCCGTGTIGISLASQVAKVIGVDIVEQAVEDARRNAALNGIANTDWVCGKAEDVMQSLLDRGFALCSASGSAQSAATGCAHAPVAASGEGSANDPARDLADGSGLASANGPADRVAIASAVVASANDPADGAAIASAIDSAQGLADACAVTSANGHADAAARASAKGHANGSAERPVADASPQGIANSSANCLAEGGFAVCASTADGLIPAEAPADDDTSGDPGRTHGGGHDGSRAGEGGTGPAVERARAVGAGSRAVTEGKGDAEESVREEKGNAEESVTEKTGNVEESVTEENGNAEESTARRRLVAVVDPPRAGLHSKVLTALLSCQELTRLVYVSCNPDTLATNVEALCAPPGPCRGDAGYRPFCPVQAMAVDLFPHTNHCEAVMLLEREAD